MRAGGFLAPANPVHNSLQLLQDWGSACYSRTDANCVSDGGTILAIFCVLLAAVTCVSCAVMRFRDHGEERVTPLCPKMVVTGSDVTFKFSMSSQAERIDVLNHADPKDVLARICMDWPDPTRDCASGITSTARLQNMAGMTLATVVARNTAVSGQALAICRSGCEIFGFVEPEPLGLRYHVKHRTGVHLLSLVGDFAKGDIDAINPAGMVVFSAKEEEGCCVGTVTKDVDAGLIISCILATRIHRYLLHSRRPAPPPHVTVPPMGTLPKMRSERTTPWEEPGASAAPRAAEPGESEAARLTEPSDSDTSSGARNSPRILFTQEGG